ncbi:hypothetical protein OB08_15115 [Microbacterium sp. HJ5]
MWLLVAVGLGAILLLVRVGFAMDAPDAFAQAFDNVFHLNAVRWILDTADASPANVARLSAPSGGSMYPSAWHAIGALVVQVSGVSIPIASNAALIVFGCVAWPAGIVVLSRALFGGSRSLLVSAGALAAAFGPFPLALVAYLGTYPLVLAVSMLPVVLAATVEVGQFRLSSLGPACGWIVVALSVPALLLAHPSVLVAVPVLAFPVAVSVAGRMWTSKESDRRRRLAILGVTVYVAATMALLVYVRPSADSLSEARGTAGQGIGEAITSTVGGQPLSIGAALLVILGVVLALRAPLHRGRVAAGMWVVGAALYAITAGAPEFWRLLLSGPWYTDAMRVGTIVSATCVPVAAYAAASVWRLIGLRVARTSLRQRSWVRPLIAAASSLLLVIICNGPGAWAVAERAHAVFVPVDDALTAVVSLSEDERELLEKVEAIVPDGELIGNNPWDGSALAYALTGRPVLFPHMIAVRGQPGLDFRDGFSSAGSDDPACIATRDLSIRWVLDLASDTGSLPNTPRFEGLEDLASSPNVELEARVGDATLYRIIGCEVG